MSIVDKRPPSPLFYRPADLTPATATATATATQALKEDPAYLANLKAFDFTPDSDDHNTPRLPNPNPAPAIPTRSTKNGVNTRGTLANGATRHPQKSARQRVKDAAPKDPSAASSADNGAEQTGRSPEQVLSNSAAPPNDNGLARTQAVSQVENLIDQDGVLTFTLRIPAANAGEPDETYRISVTGGQRTGLSSIEREKLAKHLTKAIRLVQTDAKTKGFSSISFEGKPSDSGFAKAVVHVGKKSFILGGDNTQRVFDSDKIFADELHALLQDLQESLRSGLKGINKVYVQSEQVQDGTLRSAAPSAPAPNADHENDDEDTIRNAGRLKGSVPQSLAEQGAPPNSPILPGTQSPVTDESKGKKSARFEELSSHSLEDEDDLTAMTEQIDAVHNALLDNGQPGPSRSKA